MRNTLLIARRDLAAHLHSYSGYIIIAAMLFLDGLFFNAFALGGGALKSHEVLERFFYFASGSTMIAGVLLTMRSFAEERAEGSDVLLSTSPVSDGAIVVGKWSASMGMLTLKTLLTIYMPLLIFWNGKVSLSHLAVGYLGLLALGASATAMGTFASSLFKSQVAAAILGGVILSGFVLAWLLSSFVDPPFSDPIAYMAVYDKHFKPLEEGRLALSSLVYYGTICFSFLWLTTRVVAGRRWQ